MSAARLARPEIQSLEPYEAAVQVADTVRMNANEAPWCSDPGRFRRPLNRYPEVRPARLQRALAKRFCCRSEELLVTRGTSEAIDLLMRAFCRSGIDNIVTASPTFSMYKHYALVQNAEVREVPANPDEDFAIDVRSLLDTCDDNSRLIFVCSPNNPTGTLVSSDTIASLLERRAGRSVVVVDEAYIEFADVPSAVGLLDRYDNLVILRTLSKALAFAGARCGAAIGAADVIALLNAVQAPYALATPVVECVEDALSNERLEEARAGVSRIVEERERLSVAVGALPFVDRVWPSAANFLLMRVSNVDEVLSACEDQDILLRYFGEALDGCIRVTVGSPPENDRLLGALHALGNSA